MATSLAKGEFGFSNSNHPWVKVAASGIATITIPSNRAKVCPTCVKVVPCSENGNTERWLGYATNKPHHGIVGGSKGIKQANGSIVFQMAATLLNGKLWASGLVQAVQVVEDAPKAPKAPKAVPKAPKAPVVPAIEIAPLQDATNALPLVTEGAK